MSWGGVFMFKLSIRLPVLIEALKIVNPIGIARRNKVFFINLLILVKKCVIIFHCIK